MSLRKYLHQVRPREESYVNHVDRIQGLLTEVSLSGKSTNGIPNVQKYVTDNPKALEIDYEIEKNKTDVPIFDEDGNEIGKTQQGATFKLKSKKLFSIDNKPALHTSIGIIPAKFVRKPSGFKAMDAEVAATNELDAAIKKAVKENNGNPIDLKIGRFTIKGAIGAGSDHIKKDPKADITIFDQNGKEIGFISHKKEGGAKGFSQYGGFSVASGLDDKEIDSFIKKLSEIYKKERPRSGDAFYRPLKSNVLINKTVYGPEYGGPFSRDNVHCIGQGTPIVERRGKNYTLSFSETMHVNGDVRFAKRGKFTAVFGATFRNGRRIQSKDGSVINNVRGGIYPIAYMQSRRKLKEI